MKTILFADDSATVRYLVREYLGDDGYDLLEAPNGKRALELIRERRPDLALLDLQMPEIDGFAVCEAIKQDLDIPVIILTSMDNEADRDWAMDSGADEYLTKPVEREHLLATVHQFLQPTACEEEGTS